MTVSRDMPVREAARPVLNSWSDHGFIGMYDPQHPREAWIFGHPVEVEP
jgi:hypothetical protein